jgi:hypothetical protein
MYCTVQYVFEHEKAVYYHQIQNDYTLKILTLLEIDCSFEISGPMKSITRLVGLMPNSIQ